ncbi:uncharacterized protein BJ171DRAFT_128259 [Polychytrium aggregatum]|uniref:uncharacterized protein n=1 Tax=Polychytrium aggregatum TaxID=110093 RepID=UPI0022FE01D3|nr:uncharacterized protein BJ171DRAFT_128259 [Polychytrium aggregatum]KAI9204068.1 hypothetical protein BJ171DRAFT_128259 [Polychytrium aggregatum]
MSLYGDLPPPTGGPSASSGSSAGLYDAFTPAKSASSSSTAADDKKKSAMPGWLALDRSLQPTLNKKAGLPKPKVPVFRPTISAAAQAASLAGEPKSQPLSNSTTAAKPVVGDWHSKKKAQGKRPAPMSLDDEYDPSRPNEYDAFKQQLKQRKEEEKFKKFQEDQRRNSRRSPSPDRTFPYSARAEPLRDIPPRPMPTVPTPVATSAATRPMDMDLSGEDAYLRRMRMSNSAPTEPVSLARPESIRTAAPPEQNDVDTSGRSLGVFESALASSTAQVMGAPQIPQQEPEGAAGPTTVLLLTNMVGPGEVDDTLQDETAEECSKYGQVERCLIFEVPDKQVPDDKAVRIFVKFKQVASAVQALNNLNGRYFGGRTVKAIFFDPARFDRYDLAPQL